MRSSLSRHWVTPRTPEEDRAAIRDVQRRALRDDYAVIRLSEVGCEIMRKGIEQEARKQAGVGGRNG